MDEKINREIIFGEKGMEAKAYKTDSATVKAESGDFAKLAEALGLDKMNREREELQKRIEAEVDEEYRRYIVEALREIGGMLLHFGARSLWVEFGGTDGKSYNVGVTIEEIKKGGEA